MIKMFRHIIARESVKLPLRLMLRWSTPRPVEEGFSIVLGVPWDLRDLLAINLRFVAQTDLADLRTIHVVFDRCWREGMDTLAAEATKAFPQLPLQFHHYPKRAGRIIEKTNVSTFYNSMNTVLALDACTTRYAVLHDFDLYPLVPNYFTEIVGAMRDRDLRFSGLELTPFDGLTKDDALLGTWALGIDVPWLRANWQPIHCFHRMGNVNGRMVNLDPYSWIQTHTPHRDLVRTIGPDACCHVKNLCSTYLRFITGRWAKIAWRLHYLWYLQYAGGDDAAFIEAQRVMNEADTPIIAVCGCEADFADTDVTCANVLRDELYRMEEALVGNVRSEVKAYVDAFEAFLLRQGKSAAAEVALV